MVFNAQENNTSQNNTIQKPDVTYQLEIFVGWFYMYARANH